MSAIQSLFAAASSVATLIRTTGTQAKYVLGENRSDVAELAMFQALGAALAGHLESAVALPSGAELGLDGRWTTAAGVVATGGQVRESLLKIRAQVRTSGRPIADLAIGIVLGATSDAGWPAI